MALALILVVIIALYAFREIGKKGSNIKSDSFSDELYDYSIKSKGKLRNPHMSMRAMRHRMMKRR